LARIRTIKPSFFTSDDVSALPLRARLTWIGLWTHCDDAGRAKDNVRLIKAAIWPLDDVSLRDIEDDLGTLADRGRIVRYEADGQRYLAITNWSEHQKISRPTPSKIPEPSPNGTGPLSEDSRQEGKGKEGKGTREAREPPQRCPTHKDNPNPPKCGPCADARRLHDVWRAERDKRLAAGPKCPDHRGQPADNCAGCAADRKAAA
jgi:hypothetical protein